MLCGVNHWLNFMSWNLLEQWSWSLFQKEIISVKSLYSILSVWNWTTAVAPNFNLMTYNSCLGWERVRKVTGGSMYSSVLEGCWLGLCRGGCSFLATYWQPMTSSLSLPLSQNKKHTLNPWQPPLNPTSLILHYGSCLNRQWRLFGQVCVFALDT